MKKRSEVIDAKTLKQKCEKFEKVEKRAKFYDIAMEIVEEHPLQASIILLATWNTGRFRFAMNNLTKLENTLKLCKPLFEKIKEKTKDKRFQDINFDEIKDVVKKIYNYLSKVEGVEYTGASKIMHLFNKELFVMWDDCIRKKYGCGKDAESYIEFQKKMQEKFKHIKWRYPNKTLTKAIDEYNYMEITWKLKNENKNKKKEIINTSL